MRTVHVLTLVLTTMLALFSSIPVTAQQGTLQAATFETLASATIPAIGGSITVYLPNHPLNGLSVAIPAGAFSDARNVSVAAAAIATHTFGAQLNALTHLIKLDFGNTVASETIDIRIPVNLGTTPFARGLSYDATTSALHDLPVSRIATGTVAISLRRDALPFLLSGPPRFQ